MLKLLRKKGVAKKVIWFIAILIIISFGFFGTASLLNYGGVSYAGKIFGKNITLDEFQDAFKQVEVQAIIRYGDKFRQIRQYLNLEIETWDRLILLRETKNRKIKIANKDVIEAIQQYIFFQRDGRFDEQLYNDLLFSIFRMNPRDFEESVRDSLKFNNLFQQETKLVTLTNEEIFEAYKKENEKVQISYIFISPEQFEDRFSINDEEAQKYYAGNKLKFLLPSSINVDYMTLDFPEKEPEEKEDTTENNEDDPDDDSGRKRATREKADMIYDELNENPDLDLKASAQKHDLEVRSSGFFSKEKPNLKLGWSFELLNTIFGMEPDQINEPLETDKAVYILKVKEKKEAYVPEYSEAEEEVKKALLKKKTEEITQVEAEKYLIALKEEMNKTKLKDFPKAAKALQLEIYQTPLFKRGEYLPKIGLSREFQEAAFALNDQNKISRSIKTDKGYCILHLDDYVDVDQEKYTKSKYEFSQQLLNLERDKAWSDYLRKLRTEAKLENNLTQN